MTNDDQTLRDTWPDRHRHWAPMIPLAVGLLVRLLGIVARPIWYDEAFAILFARKGPYAMLLGTLSQTSWGASDVHPLGYYTLLWGWMSAFGDSIVSTRLLSIAASLGTILVVYLLASDLFGARTALAAGLLLALSPLQVHYGQEIRMYALLGLWLATATYCYWRASRTSQWQWWTGFAISAALAQYTHNLAAFYLLCLALWPLLTRSWRTLRAVFVAGAAAIALYLPWLIHLPAQFAKVDLAYWIDKPAPYRFLTLLLAFTTNIPLQPAELAPGLFVALSVLIFAVNQTFQAARMKDPGWERAIWLFYLGFSPPLLLWLFSQWKPAYLERALLPSGTAFLVWVAWALTQRRMNWPVRVLTALLVATGFIMGLHEHLTYQGFPYGPFKAMAQRIESRLGPGDVVVHSSKLSMLPMAYLDPALPTRYVADAPGSPVDTLAPATQRVLGLEASADIASAVADAERVWFVIFDRSEEEYLRGGYPTHPHLEWLLAHFAKLEVEDWGDLRLYLFSGSP